MSSATCQRPLYVVDAHTPRPGIEALVADILGRFSAAQSLVVAKRLSVKFRDSWNYLLIGNSRHRAAILQGRSGREHRRVGAKHDRPMQLWGDTRAVAAGRASSGDRWLLDSSFPAFLLRGLDAQQRPPSLGVWSRRAQPAQTGSPRRVVEKPLQQRERQQAAHLRAHSEVPCGEPAGQV